MFFSLHKDLWRLFLLTTNAKTFYALSFTSKHMRDIMEGRYLVGSKIRLAKRTQEIIPYYPGCYFKRIRTQLPKGTLEGPEELWHMDGGLRWRRHWRDSLLHGLDEDWSHGGDQRRISLYVNGKRQYKREYLEPL